MSFWDTFEDDGNTSTSSILSKDSFTIYEVFDQEDIISEAAAHSELLVEYLVKDEQMDKMFELMTNKSDVKDNDHQYKYPWICCEIIRINITPITEKLFANNFQYLRKYSEILDRKPPLDNLQAEYYSRIISKFLELKKEKILEFLFSIEGYFAKLVNHIENGSILNLFQALIDSLCIEVEDKGELPGMILEDKKDTDDEDNEDRNYRVKKSLDDNHAKRIVEEKVIKGLMQQIGPEKSILTNENVSQAVVYCIERSIPGSPIRQELQGDNGIGALVQVLKNIDLNIEDEKVSSAFVSGVDIMIRILFITPKKSYELTRNKEDLPLSVQYVSELVPKFVPFLDVPCYLKGTNKKEIIGAKRMKIVEFIDALITVQYQYLDALLTSNKSFVRILKLFFKFENNNLVQRIVANTFLKIFEGPSDKLKQYIISSPIFDAVLLEFLNNEKYPYKSYRGFLIELISIFEKLAENYPPIQKKIEKSDVWKKAIPLIDEAKKVEKAPLGGQAPIHVHRDSNFITTKDIDMIGSKDKDDEDK